MNKVSKEQKSNLAKLLATENINVIHQKVQTAYFIPKARTLCLPMWEDMSNDLYDLLVGHEVGHALYTPTDESEFTKHKIPHSYFNVVEDIRIDKKMKIKYPGLRKSYFNGYNELVEKDFFLTKDKDVNGLRFIDRLNIFSKSGSSAQIEFNDIEQEFITRSDKLNTWADVVKLTKDIFEYSGTEKYDEEQEQEMKSELGQDGQGDQQEQSEQEEGNGDSDEQQEQNQKTTSSSESDNDKQEDEQQSSAGSDSKEDKEEEKQKGSASSGSEGGYKVGNNEALTDHASEQNKKDIAKVGKDIRENIYLSLPKCKDAVVPYDLIAAKIETQNSSYPMSKRLEEFKTFKREQMRTVNYMVKEFEMKKAADSYVRTRTARTGMINTNALHSYKYNDDIFARINIEPGAKNHGMVMIVDWSGSMGDKLYDTLVQTMNLVMFCKAVNIPFEVYAFSDTNKSSFINEGDNVFRSRQAYSHYPYQLDKEGLLVLEDVSLLQFVTSDMKTVKYNEAMANLYQIALVYQHSYTHRRFNNPDYDPYAPMFHEPHCLRLGGTPLDSAIYQSINVVNKFKAKHKVQKMNTIFLTDGSGHTMGKATLKKDNGEMGFMDTYMYDINVKDGTYSFTYGKNTKKFRSHFHAYHRQFLSYFKHKTGSTVIGYYVAGKALKYWDVGTFATTDGYDTFEKARAEMRKNKVVTMTDIGYDELFITTKTNMKVDDTEMTITSDMTAGKMKQQFSKNFKQKKMSRVLLNKFVERVA